LVVLCAALAKRFTIKMTLPPSPQCESIKCTYQSKLFVYRLRLSLIGARRQRLQMRLIYALDALDRARGVSGRHAFDGRGVMDRSVGNRHESVWSVGAARGGRLRLGRGSCREV
jgi:hypothetical protein